MNTTKIPEAKKGLGRALRAFKFSWAGFKVIVKEDAFFQELVVSAIAIPFACFLNIGIVLKLLMIIAPIGVMLVEVINTSVEAVVDLVSPDYHKLAKVAKDLGSLSVLIAICMALIIWLTGLYQAFFI